MLFNEPKLLKFRLPPADGGFEEVSVLFNEPKLLKSPLLRSLPHLVARFSALQRAEIAEIGATDGDREATVIRFSALQRAEIAEIAERDAEPRALNKFQCSSTSRNC